MEEKAYKPKMKLSGRILVFNKGKNPEHDKPDEVINLGMRILNMDEEHNAKCSTIEQ